MRRPWDIAPCTSSPKNSYGTFRSYWYPPANDAKDTNRRSTRIVQIGITATIVTLSFYIFAVSFVTSSSSTVGSILLPSVTDSFRYSVEVEKPPYPHVIFMLVDDQGFNDIGYASTDLDGASPCIDSLAATGIILKNYYSQHLCTPARSAFMTGIYPIHNGMQHDVISPRAPWGLPLSNTLMPGYLKIAGYVTHAVGKWHLGFYDESFLPTNRGFSSFFGYLTDQMHYYDHTYPRMYEGVYYNDFIEMYHEYKNWTLRDDLKGQYSVELFTTQACKILEKHSANASTPLFLYMAYQNVHGPLEAPPSISFTRAQQQILGGIPNGDRRIFARMLMTLDSSIKRIYEVLESQGMLQNSFLFYSSDNGGCHYAGSYNAPLRGGKHYLFEGGIRVHGFIHSPLLPSAVVGHSYEGLMHITDWLPTILNAVGLEHLKPEGIDGLNQWNALLQRDVPPRHEILHNIDNFMSLPGHNGTSYLAPMNHSYRAAIRVGHMKLIVNEYDVPWYDPRIYQSTNDTLNETYMHLQDCAIPPITGIMTWLFNISSDPTEKWNLADAHPDIVAHLKERILIYMKTLNLPAWQPDDSDATLTWNLTGFFTPWTPLARNRLGSHLYDHED